MPDDDRTEREPTPSGDDNGHSEGESRDEQLNRELIELLNELRVALPGVQVLFAFLLTIPFTGSVFKGLSDFQRDVYFATFCSTIVATALMMTPTAYHRLRWRRRDKERMLQISNRMAIAGLVALAAAITGSAYLIADLLFGRGAAAVTVIAAVAVIGGLWFVLPLTREATDRQD
jgi:predicted membrane channel-forming protein YqfA (hemolysin III family)